MLDSTAFNQSIMALTQYMVGDVPMATTLGRVAELIRVALPQTCLVGLTMMVDGRVDTFVFTDPEIAQIDRAQYETGAGPCIDAYRTGATNVITSTVDDTRWPQFCRVARAHSVLSTLSLPTSAADRPLGALNLYARSENAYGGDAVRTGDLFAAHAGYVLANAQSYWEARSMTENLQAALLHRSVIEQAKGVIMGATRCSPDAAFRHLVTQSQQEHVKLRDLAEQIVLDATRQT